MTLCLPKRSLCILLAGSLAGCGTYLPDQDFRYPNRLQFNDFVQALTFHVRCELRQAIAEEYFALPGSSPGAHANRQLLSKWAAKIALTLRGIEKSQANPSVLVAATSATFTTSIGAAFQANATREMTMTYFLPFQTLIKETEDLGPTAAQASCETGGYTFPISGNLGIHQTLEAGFESWDTFYPTSNDVKSGDPFDTITHHVIFDIQAGGGATPSWKFSNVTVNPTGPFFNASRQQTDELLITMGPAVIDKKKLLPSSSNALNENFFIERLRSAIQQPIQ